MNETQSRYPRELSLNGADVRLALLRQEDDAAMAAFAASLNPHDLLFLSRDITEPKVRAAWSAQIRSGDIVSVAAWLDDEIVGTTAVVVDQLSFSAHVGELRVLLGPKVRGMGLGRILIQEAFLVGVDLGIEKLTCRMTLDQDAAITIFEELGFRREAMFQNHVKDQAGNVHDLLVMSQEVDRFQARMSVYGLDSISEAN